MGWPEIMLIGMLAVLLFGPDKLPHIARQTAGFVRTVRRMAQDAKQDLTRELGHDLDLGDLNPRSEVRRASLPPGDVPPIDSDAT